MDEGLTVFSKTFIDRQLLKGVYIFGSVSMKMSFVCLTFDYLAIEGGLVSGV